MIKSYLGDDIHYCDHSDELFCNWWNFITCMSFDKFSSPWYFFITLMIYHHTNKISLNQWVSIKLGNFTVIHFHLTNERSSYQWSFIYLINFHPSENFLSHWWIFILLIPFHHINGLSSNSSILMTKNNEINQLFKPHTLTNLLTYLANHIARFENHLVSI